MCRHPRLERLAPFVALAALAPLAGGCASRADADAVPVASAPRDTATLDAAAVRLAGLEVVRADSAPWRERWTSPARLILDPAQTQHLGAIAEGRVTRVLVNVGDAVRAGQVLVAVHSHELLDARSTLSKADAGAASAAAALGLAESGAARAERLYALKALSLADLERARTALAEARSMRAAAVAELTRARSLRDHLVGVGPTPRGMDEHEVLVRAPEDGIVVARDAQPGAVVLVGAPLVTVSRTTSLVLSTSVPERALASVAPNGEIAFGVAALPGERFAARIVRVAPTLDTATRTVEVQARVLGGASRLRGEMYATAELLGPPGPRTLGVPADAIQDFDGDTVVVAARPSGAGLALEAMRVRVGRRASDRVEILAGIDAGTPVVTKGAAIARAELLRRRGS